MSSSCVCWHTLGTQDQTRRNNTSRRAGSTINDQEQTSSNVTAKAHVHAHFHVLSWTCCWICWPLAPSTMFLRCASAWQVEHHICDA
eukprot:4674926-Alexandrium_andersonii.AAC.1